MWSKGGFGGAVPDAEGDGASVSVEMKSITFSCRGICGVGDADVGGGEVVG